MKVKTSFLLLLMVSFIPAISAAYADPSPSLRVVVAENEFTEDEGNVLLMPTNTGSPTALELGLFPVPHPDGDAIYPNDVESYDGDVYAVDGFDGFGLGLLKFDLDPAGAVLNIETISTISNFQTPISIDIVKSGPDAGIIFVADSNTNTIYKIDPTSGSAPFTPTIFQEFTGSEVVTDIAIDDSANILYVLDTNGGYSIIPFDISDGSMGTPRSGTGITGGIQFEVLEGTSEFYLTNSVAVHKITSTSDFVISGSFSFCDVYGIAIEELSTSFDIYVSDSCDPDDDDLPGSIFRLSSDSSAPFSPILEAKGGSMNVPFGIGLISIGSGPNADLEVTKTTNLPTASVGNPIDYIITATNLGPEAIDGFQVVDTLDTGLEFSAVSGFKNIGGVITSISPGECTNTAGNPNVVCTFSDTFDTNDFAEITITADVNLGATNPISNYVVILAVGPIDDPDNTNNDFTLLTPLEISPEFTLTKTGDQLTVIAGQNDPLVYDIFIKNDGVDVTQVTITDTLPPGLTFDAFSNIVPSTATCNHNAGVIDCNFGDLLNNQEAGVDVSVLVDADASGSTIQNTVDLDCTECSSPISTTETTNLVRSSDLTLTKTADHTSVVAGQPTPLKYTLTIDNAGPSTGTNVVLNDNVPVGLSITSVSPSPECTNTGNLVTCNFAQIPAGQTVITIETTVDSSATNDLTNSASVTSDEDAGPNNASITIPLTTSADLVLDKMGPSTVSPGQTFDYTFDITNSGPSDSLDIQLIDQLPSGVTFVSSPDNCQDVDADGEVICHDPFNPEDISAGTTLTKTITVLLDPSAPLLPIQNDATVNSFLTSDPDETNDSDFVVTQVEQNVADLEIEKSSEVIVTGGTSGVIDVRVIQSSDDAEEDDDEVYVDDNDLDINEKDYVGLRFQDIQIPSGATITNAYVKFTVEDEKGDKGNAEVIIHGEDSDNASTFLEIDNDISSRTFTTANVEWDIPNWHNENESGPAQTSPDISSIIQEIVDRAGWSNGNSLVIIIEEDKGKDRDAKAWDLDPSKAPLLHVEFDNNDEMTEVIYTLTITNHGPGDATTVQVTDNLPPQVTATNVVPTPECSIDGPQLVTCEFALLTSGSQQIVTIDTTVDPGTTGTITNIASVSADQEDPDETNNEVSHETEISSGELFCGRLISEFNVIDGTPNADVLIGTHDDDLIRGFGGNDFINAKKGDDCIFGGEGNDKILGGHDDDSIEGNEGKDRIFGGKGDDIMFGNEGNDRLMGGLGDDGISGGEGRDIIRGGPGDDRVSAGPGDDKIFGQSGDDSLSADSGNDKVFGGNGDDFLNGGENHDFCRGGPGEDVITNCEKGDPNTGGGDTKQLTGTIRDFKKNHDDMEQGCSGGLCSSVETGIVKDILGADGKPEFNQDTISTNGEANFNQWYNDVNGVNKKDDITLTLDNTITPDPTVYTFESGPGFFPIDGKLYKNQGLPHNYHFTIELHSTITFQAGQMFKFTGDDDVWVFIGDQLVIDLGGVHPQSSAEITSQDLIDLGLEPGEEHDLDIFFAERQTVQSNFRIDTSMIMD